MVRVTPTLLTASDRNKYRLQKQYLRKAIYDAVRHRSDLSVRSKSIGLTRRFWSTAYLDYQDSGIQFGEFAVCACATGTVMNLGQAQVNFNSPLPVHAGYDFKVFGFPIEVKTMNNAGVIHQPTAAQLDTALVFVVYNVNSTMKRFFGHDIYAESVRVFTNREMRRFYGMH